MVKNAIEIKNLSKIYDGNVKALDKINLNIPTGSFFGLLGPNGAGKTTTIGILTGLVNLTSGSAKIMGKDSVKDYRNTRPLVGLSPQELNFDVFFTIREILILQAGYYGLPKAMCIERADLMIEHFGLIDKSNSKARELSGGMKRRVQIAKSLVHDPPILILDEPTAGVDIELRHMLWSYLKELNKKGKTILLTTHYIEEAESLCDDIAIIDTGKIITKGSPKELINEIGLSMVEFVLDKKYNTIDLVGWEYKLIDNILTVNAKDPESEIAKIISELNKIKIGIIGVKILNNSLEDVFIELTGHGINEGESIDK